jgi:hypothetical protein
MNIFKLISYIPLLGILLLLYFLMVYIGVDFNNPVKLFDLALPSGAAWNLTSADIFVILGVITLYVEIIKSVRTGTGTIVEHVLSVVVFILFLILFLLVPVAGTSTFMIITLMSLLDVIAGFTITVASARRDFSMSPQ